MTDIILPKLLDEYIPPDLDEFPLPELDDEYFLPELGDEFLPELGDEFLPELGDEFLPDLDDEFLPDLDDEFMSLDLNEFPLPELGDESIFSYLRGSEDLNRELWLPEWSNEDMSLYTVNPNGKKMLNVKTEGARHRLALAYVFGSPELYFIYRRAVTACITAIENGTFDASKTPEVIDLYNRIKHMT